MRKKPKKENKENKEKQMKPIKRNVEKSPLEQIESNIPLIIKMREEGHSIEGIARALGMCRTTFYNNVGKNPKVVEALQVGQYAYNHNLKKAAMQRAVGYIQELTKTRKEYKVVEGARILVKVTEDIEEKLVTSDMLAFKLLGLDKYNNIDKVPDELKELFEKYKTKTEDEEDEFID